MQTLSMQLPPFLFRIYPRPSIAGRIFYLYIAASRGKSNKIRRRGFLLKVEDDPVFIVFVYQEVYLEHLTAKEIEAFIEGSLNHKERKRILEHLDHCPLCVDWLADGRRRSWRRLRCISRTSQRLQTGPPYP